MMKIYLVELTLADIVDLLNRDERNPPPVHLDATKAAMDFALKCSDDTEDTLTVSVEV